MQLSVHISGPYFAPLMLEQLDMSYVTYVYFLAIAFLARIITLSFWGSIAKQFGAGTLMWAGAVSLIPLASFSVKYIAFRVLGLRPATAALDVPVVFSLDPNDDKE